MRIQASAFNFGIKKQEEISSCFFVFLHKKASIKWHAFLDFKLKFDMQQTKTHSHHLMQIMQQMMQDMQSMQPTGDPDHDFAMMVRRHHEGAIAMAKVELEHGQHQELQTMAEKMIAEQKKDNEKFNAFLLKHQPQHTDGFGKKAIEMAKKASQENMEMQNDVDLDFASLMIRHHNDGIEMTNEYLKSGKEEEIRNIADNEVASQSEDIKKLEKFLANNR